MNGFSCPPPNAADIHQAAITYLARYAATCTSLRRVLHRRIERWLHQQQDKEAASAAIIEARVAIEAEIAKLVKAGAIDDQSFAVIRAAGLSRAGKSRRAIQQRLAAKGVDPALARAAAASDADTELAAALILARRRRIGLFAPACCADAATKAKHLAVLARAGFDRQIAEQALQIEVAEAEERINNLRR